MGETLMAHRKMGRRHEEFRAAQRMRRQNAEEAERLERRHFWANFGPEDAQEGCESVFEQKECIRPAGHLEEGWVHMNASGTKWGHREVS